LHATPPKSDIKIQEKILKKQTRCYEKFGFPRIFIRSLVVGARWLWSCWLLMTLMAKNAILHATPPKSDIKNWKKILKF